MTCVEDHLTSIKKALPDPGKAVVIKRQGSKTHNVKYPYAIATLVRHTHNYHEFINSYTGARINGVVAWAYIERRE